MLRINDISYSNTALFLEEAIKIAEYYGFTETDEALSSHRTSAVNAKRVDESKISFVRRDEKPLLDIVHTCADRGLGSGSKPLFLWKEGSTLRSSRVRSAGPSGRSNRAAPLCGNPAESSVT